jgi:hypothetical protein
MTTDPGEPTSPVCAPTARATLATPTGSTTVTDVRDLYLASGGIVVDTVQDAAVAAAWPAQSALPGMTVGALVAHTARALSTVRGYLDGDAPPADGPVLDAAGYVVAVLPDTDRDAPVNRSVLGRAVSGAASGHGAVTAQAVDDLASLRRTLPQLPADLRLSVLDGTPVTLDEYLATRIVELVVHLDDIDHSVPRLDPEPLPDEACAVAVGVLAEVARRRTSTAAMVALLARRERVGSELPHAL